MRSDVENRGSVPTDGAHFVAPSTLRMTITELRTLDRAIVFLWAGWSGPSYAGYRWLIAFLQQRGVAREQVLVLDVDEHPELATLPELSGRIHGWGEVVVIRGGSIFLVAAVGKDVRRSSEVGDAVLRAYLA